MEKGSDDNEDYDEDYFDLEDQQPPQGLASLILARSAKESLAMALQGPFVLARILVQVQHIPRRINSSDNNGSIDIDNDSDSDYQYDEEAEEGYRYRQDRRQRRDMSYALSSDEESLSSDFNSEEDYDIGSYSKSYNNVKKLRVDDIGYVVPGGYARPAYQMAPLRSGLWNTMQRISSFRHEGFFALWKASFPYWLVNACVGSVQPELEDLLNEKLDLFDPSIVPMHHQRNFWPNLTTRVLSFTICKFFVLPINVLLTHIAVQTSDPLHAPYRSTWDAFKQVMLAPYNTSNKNDSPSSTHNRGFFRKFKDVLVRMYPFPTFHFFSILLEECMHAATHVVLRRYFDLSPTATPIKYGLAYFLYETISLVITLPLKTIQRRLHVCGRMHGGGNRRIGGVYVVNDAVELQEPEEEEVFVRPASCVRLVDKPYRSPWDCFIRVIREEAIGSESTSDTTNETGKDGTKKVSKKRKKSKLRDGVLGGVAQLYRGFWLETYLNAFICGALYIVRYSDISNDSDYMYY